MRFHSIAAWSGLAGAALMAVGAAAGNAGGPPPSPAAPRLRSPRTSPGTALPR